MLNKSLNQKGNSILLVIIGLLVLSGTCIELLSGGISQMPNLIKNYRATSARDSVDTSMMNRLSFAGVYRSSVHPDVIATNVNQKLLVCIVGQPGQLCEADDLDRPVSLFSWETDASLNTSLKKISGDTTAPVSYDMKGALCPPTAPGASSNCPFLEVVTTFKAVCANNTPTCATAKAIKVKYVIQLAPSATANGSVALASKERESQLISVLDILPLKQGSVGQFAKIGTLVTGDTAVTPELIAAIEAASDLRGEDAKLFASLAKQAGVTDKNLLLGLAASVSASGLKMDLQSIKDYADLIKSLNITDPVVLASLPISGERNPVQLAAMANAITNAGITDVALAKQIVWYRITDPVTVAAFVAPKNQSIMDAIDASGASGRWWQPQAANAIASYMYTAGITSVTPENKGLVDALSYAGIIDTQQVKDIAKVFQTNHITDQAIMNAVSIGRLTDPVVAKQFTDSISSVGVTDPYLIVGLALGSITESTQVANFVNSMAALGPGADSWTFSRTGIADMSTFNNFVSTIIKLGFATDDSSVQSLARSVRDGNITSKADMELVAAAILASKNPITVVSTPTVATSGTGATPTVADPITVQNFTASCTTNCGVSAF